MISAHSTLRWDELFGQLNRATVQHHALSGDSQAHDHDFMEMVVVLEGEATHESTQGELPLHSGTAILLRPGTWHAYRKCSGLELINFCFPLSMARAEWRELLDERVRFLLRSGEGLQVAQLSDFATHSLQQLEQVERTPTGALGLIIWALDQFAASVPPPGTPFHPTVERAVSALEEQPAHPWSATLLSQTVGLDKAYLTRLFKTQVGVGPMAYVALLRAERAAFLLRNSEMNCSEVGDAVGYSDPNLFSKRFKARFGVSPSAYRTRAHQPKKGQ